VDAGWVIIAGLSRVILREMSDLLHFDQLLPIVNSVGVGGIVALYAIYRFSTKKNGYKLVQAMEQLNDQRGVEDTLSKIADKIDRQTEILHKMLALMKR